MILLKEICKIRTIFALALPSITKENYYTIYVISLWQFILSFESSFINSDNIYNKPKFYLQLFILYLSIFQCFLKMFTSLRLLLMNFQNSIHIPHILLFH